MKWEVIETEALGAKENMRLDERLLEALRDRPILHLYDWKEESATHGYFLDPYDFLKMVAKIDLGRRPTGGGVVFHLWDLAFSVLVPASSPHFSTSTLENYKFVNTIVKKAVEEFLGKGVVLIPEDYASQDQACKSFCMARPTKYDLVLEGKKVAGAAQRKRRQGYLHQGTIALSFPSEDYLNDVLLPGTKVVEATLAHTFPLLGKKATRVELEEGRKELRQLLKKYARAR